MRTKTILFLLCLMIFSFTYIQVEAQAAQTTQLLDDRRCGDIEDCRDTCMILEEIHEINQIEYEKDLCVNLTVRRVIHGIEVWWRNLQYPKNMKKHEECTDSRPRWIRRADIGLGCGDILNEEGIKCMDSEACIRKCKRRNPAASENPELCDRGQRPVYYRMWSGLAYGYSCARDSDCVVSCRKSYDRYKDQVKCIERGGVSR